MGKNDAHVIFTAYTPSNAATIIIELRKNGNNYQLRAGTLTDRKKWPYTSWITLANSWQAIALDWRAATAVGANNGSLSLTVGSNPIVSVSGLDNDTQKIDWIALSAVQGIDTATRGTYYFDALESRR